MKKKENIILAIDPKQKIYFFKNISRFSKERDLDQSHVCKCINHPKTNLSHNGYKFKKVDGRISKELTAFKYVKKILQK